MNKEIIKESIGLIDSHLKQEGLSRRDAMKVFGASGVSMLLGGGIATEATASSTSAMKAKILIIGGGLAGISTASRLVKQLDNPDITIVEPDKYSASYQSGQTLVGAGVWEGSDIIYKRDDFIPDGVALIAEKAVEFDPTNNSVKTSAGKRLKYDYLVIAAGVKLDFSKIEGLGIENTITTIGDDSEVRRVVGANGMASVYFANGAIDTWTQMLKLIADAKSGKKVKALFTRPNTPIKYEGAAQEIMYLTDARLREEGIRERAELRFLSNDDKMFAVKEYDDAIVKQFEARDMKWNYKHNLVAIDPDKKIATFRKDLATDDIWDPYLEDISISNDNERVEMPYDFIHITPPMKAAEEIANSPIGSDKGWVPVDRESLQHIDYPNVFALGDIIDAPMGKTASSVRKQHEVVADNIVSMMNGKELTAKYDGYTAYPLITSIGKVMLAEFDWSKRPTPSFPLDPTQERWMWWLLKAYLLKPMTQYGILPSRV